MIVLNKVNMTEEALRQLVNRLQFDLCAECWDLDNLYQIVTKEHGVVGLVSYTVRQLGGNNHWVAKIEAIEVQDDYQQEGYGTAVLEYIFNMRSKNNQRISRISGTAVSDSINWWCVRGANFNMSDAQIDECIYSGEAADFCISRKRFERFMEIKKEMLEKQKAYKASIGALQ